jgi:glyceraldehyde 3-phosphate dehydrogenase
MAVGINGFGRIGKHIYKILVKNGMQVNVINDPFVDINYLEYLLKYDTTFGTQDSIHIKGQSIFMNNIETKLLNEKDPSKIDWNALNVDIVVEASGVFTTLADCSKHKAKHVILTAPSKDIPMFVYGVNHKNIGPEDRIISAASCTTNCLAPLAKLINDEYGIEEGLMTTVHSVTSTQSTTDGKGSKWRSARSIMNIIPASTGAAVAVTKVIPELEGKINGMAFRVPVINCSVVDLTVKLKKPTSLEQIKNLILSSNEQMRGVLGVTEDEIVSSDVIGESKSSILDLKASMQLNPNFFKLISWYDNEYGYSCRVVDLIVYIENLKF